jgi:hypothetical protein
VQCIAAVEVLPPGCLFKVMHAPLVGVGQEARNEGTT